MFTGIVSEAGKVIEFREGKRAWHLKIEAHEVTRDVAMGDSIAVNGCCLTVVKFDETSLSFDLLGETVRLTAFADLAVGQAVNLESSLRFNGKVGGHFVSGHVDAVGEVVKAETRGKDLYLQVRIPPEFAGYLVYKGSIAIDGVSLTVAEVFENSFAVWLIPHTLEVTNLSEKAEGSKVHLEFDLLAKYVESLLKK